MRPFTLPEIDLDPAPIQVIANSAAIKQARAQLAALNAALDGLAQANAGMCTHPRRRDHYDPGCAGGGYDYTSCLDCGGRCAKER